MPFGEDEAPDKDEREEKEEEEDELTPGLEMDVDFTDTEDVDEVGAFSFIKPGTYHAEIEDVEFGEKEGKTPCVAFSMRILAGTEASEINKVHIERLYISPGMQWRMRIFAVRLGLVGRDAAGKKARVNWEEATGRQVVISIIQDDFETIDQKTGEKRMQKSTKCDKAGIWDVHSDDPLARACPKDKTVLTPPDKPDSPKGGAKKAPPKAPPSPKSKKQKDWGEAV
jgi:hypothetical protein